MSTSSTQAQPSPLRFFETVNAYQRTAVMKSAIELKLFTVVGKHKQASAAGIAKDCSATERGIRIICDYLTIDGFLQKDSQDGRYSLTPDAAMFLDQGSPAYVGTAIDFLLSDHLKGSFDLLTDSIRKGGTALPKEGALAPDHPQWIDFARAMAPLMFPSADAVAKLLAPRLSQGAKVLDMAAGHGIFGVVLAKAHGSARIVALDWKPVLQVATENAKKFGVADRHTCLAGSALKVDYGTNYDAVLITNLLHHFNVADNVKILKKAHQALKPGGVVAILEPVPNEDRISPPDEAKFSVIMLATTPAGDAYTGSELQQMCRSAGFPTYSSHPLHGMPQTLILAEK